MTPSSADDRDPVEVLADHFLEQQRLGRNPSIADYSANYPELAHEIRELFPAVLALERLKNHCEDNGVRRASLGAPAMERLGDFRLLREIGRGGMGVVYEALHESLGRHVAVKVLPKQSDKQSRAFLREARASGRLHHTNIVPLFGVGEQDGFHYIVMQLIRGVDLEAILTVLRERHTPVNSGPSPGTSLPLRTRYRQDAARLAEALLEGSCVPLAIPTSPQRPPAVQEPPAVDPDSAPVAASSGPLRLGMKYWRQVAALGRQAAEALQYAHAHQTLHRDIKPANLLLDSQGVLWITDFGLAKALDDEYGSQPGALGGTLHFMAPEQFSNQSDQRSDIYSLGITLYELLSLEPAFEEGSRGDLIRRITGGSSRPLNEVCPRLPRDLQAIVQKATARDPADRYASAAALARDLANFLEDRPVSARPMSVGASAWRWARRNRLVASLGGLALALMFTIVVFAVQQSLQRDQTLALETALRRTSDMERRRAEANLHLAAEAFEGVFQRVTGGLLPRPLADDEPVGESGSATQPPIGDREASILEGLLTFYDQFAQQNAHDLRWRHETARAFRRAGEIQFHLAHDRDAESDCQRALTLYESLTAEEPRNAEYLHGQTATRNLLASIAWERGDVGAAHRHAREAWRHLVDQPELLAGDVACQVELARAYNRYALASSLFSPPRGSRGRSSSPPRTDSSSNALRGPTAGGRPREFLERAISLMEPLFQEQPDNLDYGLTLAESYRYAWGIDSRRNNPSGAREARRQSIGVLESLVERLPDEAECLYMLAEVYLLPFRYPNGTSDIDEASRESARAMEIATDLAQRFPQLPRHRGILAEALWAVATVSARQDRTSAAQAELDRAIELQQALVQENPNRQRHQWELIRFLQERVDQAVATGDLVRQRAALEELIRAIEKFPPEPRPSSRFLLTQARALGALSRVLRGQGDHERADLMQRREEELRRRADRSGPRRSPPQPIVAPTS